MNILVTEYLTGGGMAGVPLPDSMTREADLMLRTLLDELAALPGIRLLTTRDPRLPPIPGVETLAPRVDESFLSLYHRGLERVDAAWPTAPETGGALLQLAQATLQAGRVLLGCRPAAIEIAGSKRATVMALHRAGIAAVETIADPLEIPAAPGTWVVKPDDGAGAEETHRVSDGQQARALLREGPSGARVAQPWLEGDPLSLSLLCRDGSARLLSVNRQRVVCLEDQLFLAAIEVNAVPDDDSRFTLLAQRIAEVIPGLWGYVGVDLIDGPNGAVVLEVNPRLTTSYCGLARAAGVNVAGETLALLREESTLSRSAASGGIPVALVLGALDGR